MWPEERRRKRKWLNLHMKDGVERKKKKSESDEEYVPDRGVSRKGLRERRLDMYAKSGTSREFDEEEEEIEEVEEEEEIEEVEEEEIEEEEEEEIEKGKEKEKIEKEKERKEKEKEKKREVEEEQEEEVDEEELLGEESVMISSNSGITLLAYYFCVTIFVSFDNVDTACINIIKIKSSMYLSIGDAVNLSSEESDSNLLKRCRVTDIKGNLCSLVIKRTNSTTLSNIVYSSLKKPCKCLATG